MSSSNTKRKRSSSAVSGGDENNSDTMIITQPALYDVLCGRDKTYNQHAGNQAFRAMIEQHVGPYVAAGRNKHEKMRITKAIVASLQSQYQTRFLRPLHTSSRKSNNNKKHKNNNNKKKTVVEAWHEISDAMARDKTSHALRFAAKTFHSKKKNKNNHATASKKDQNDEAAAAAAAAPSFAASLMTTSSSSSTTLSVDSSDESNSNNNTTTSRPMMDDVLVVVSPAATLEGADAAAEFAAAPVPQNKMDEEEEEEEDTTKKNKVVVAACREPHPATANHPPHLQAGMYDDGDNEKDDSSFLQHQHRPQPSVLLGQLASRITTAAGALFRNLVAVSSKTNGSNSNDHLHPKPAPPATNDHPPASSAASASAAEPEFNTLRSQDLNDIFSEPVYEHGWDNEVAKAAALTQL